METKWIVIGMSVFAICVFGGELVQQKLKDDKEIRMAEIKARTCQVQPDTTHLKK
jgi:hypothetical protein